MPDAHEEKKKDQVNRMPPLHSFVNSARQAVSISWKRQPDRRSPSVGNVIKEHLEQSVRLVKNENSDGGFTSTKCNVVANS